MAKRKMRMVSLLMSLVMVFSLLPMPVAAAEPTVIEIETAADLVSLSKQTFSEISNATIRLTQDIDMSTRGAIAPIGGNKAFNGTFDGQGYVIRNLQIKGSSKATGLFGHVGPNGMICDLGLENVTVTGDVNTGAFAGALLGTVTRCAVTGSITGWRYSGGIAGLLYGGTIEDCWADLEMNGSRYCGALFGGTDYDTKYQRATGSNASKVLFTEAPATDSSMVVRNNLVMGTVSANRYVAGLLGEVDSDEYYYSTPLETFEGNVIWVDSVTAEESDGKGKDFYGPVYADWDSSYTASANANENLYLETMSLSGKTASAAPSVDSAKLDTATAAELAMQETYEDLGWDFEDTWYWDEELKRPMLQGMDFYKSDEEQINEVREVHIATAEDFLALCSSNLYDELSNDIIYLDADIDLEGEEIEPLCGSMPFNGTFDGQDHAIRNLTIAGTEDATGLFGYVGTEGKIRNLGLDEVEVSGASNTGAIAGCLTGEIRECYATGAVTSNLRCSGGLVGTLHAGTIENCWADLEVVGTRYVGGLFGSSTWNAHDYGSPIAGIITDKSMVIRNNLVLGTVESNRYTAGLLGEMYSAKTSPLEVFEGNVVWTSKVHSKAADSGVAYYGPVFAEWSNEYTNDPETSEDNLYWKDMVVSQANNIASSTSGISASYEDLCIQPATAEDLGSQTTYENLGWDFQSVWVWNEELGHPVLKGQTLPTIPPDPAEMAKYPASVVTTYASSPKTTRAFTWHTSNAIEGTVIEAVKADEYDETDPDFTIRKEGTSYELLEKTGNSTGRNIHKVNLTGLEAGTTYYYRVGDGEEYWSPVYSFTTEREDADSFTFFSITDTQDQYEKYRKVLKHATENYPEGEFILHSGDVIQNNITGDYDEVYSVTSDYVTNLPSMVTPGNHEVNKDTQALTSGNEEPDPVRGIDNFNAHYQFPIPANGPEGYGQSVYSFAYGDAYFAVLNSNLSVYDGTFANQIAWLKADMETTGKEKAWQIVSIHHGPYTGSGSLASDGAAGLTTDEAQALIDAMEEVGIDLVIYGHYHKFRNSGPQKNGSIYYYSPGCSGGTPNVGTGDPIYAAITITEDSLTVTSHVVPIQAEEEEELEIAAVTQTKPAAELESAPSAAEDLTYTGAEQNLLSASGSATAGTMLYSLDGETYSEEIPTAIDAGTYTVYYKVGGKEHSDTEPVRIEVTIAPKDIAGAEITLGAALTYTGEEQTQTVESVVIDGLAVTYTVSGNTAVEAGEYTLTVTGDGNFCGTATKVWTMAEKTDDNTGSGDNTGDDNTGGGDNTGDDSTGSGDNTGGSEGGTGGSIAADGSIGGGNPGYRPVISETHGGNASVNSNFPRPGDKVTVTPDADDGFVADGIVIRDQNGNKLEVTDNGDGTYSYVQPVGQVTIEVIFEELVPLSACPKNEICIIADFTDADPTAWYHDGLHYCLEHGLMNGKTETTFVPDGNITRQQVWMILARMSGANPANMAEARAWAMDHGISDGTVPGGAITRQQLAAMLYRYAQQRNCDVSVGEDTNILSYEDVFRVSEYAIPALQWSCGSGVMGGYTDGTLRPLNHATRAHAAVMFQRFCEYVLK